MTPILRREAKKQLQRQLTEKRAIKKASNKVTTNKKQSASRKEIERPAIWRAETYFRALFSLRFLHSTSNQRF